jgi:hypothetical protein
MLAVAMLAGEAILWQWRCWQVKAMLGGQALSSVVLVLVEEQYALACRFGVLVQQAVLPPWTSP